MTQIQEASTPDTSALLRRLSGASLARLIERDRPRARPRVERRASIAAFERAPTDCLTGAHGREAFFAAAEEALAAARRADAATAVLIIDVDRFRAVNESFGHAVGDHLLRALSARWRASLRGYDLLGRVGGDDFAAVLPGAALDDGAAAAERLRAEAANAPHLVERSFVPVSISVGVAEIGADETVEIALARADDALFAAKRGGRNRVERAPARD